MLKSQHIILQEHHHICRLHKKLLEDVTFHYKVFRIFDD